MQLEQINERYRLKALLTTLGLFLLLAIVGGIFTPTRLITLLSIMLGLFLYLILPGYLVLLNVELDDIERVILSTAVGISLIPIILFLLNLFWIRISFWLVVALILLVSLAGIALREHNCSKKENSHRK
jgi:uncharacterized membrane protein